MALVVSALIFAGIHFELLLLPGLFVAGLLFGYLAQRSGRLGPAIFAHIGFNVATIVALAWIALTDPARRRPLAGPARSPATGVRHPQMWVGAGGDGPATGPEAVSVTAPDAPGTGARGVGRPHLPWMT